MATYGAWEGAFLTSSPGQRYLFISNRRGDVYDVNSPIYKWYSQYDKFYFVQNVATQGASTPVLFDIGGTVYLLVTFYRGDSSGFNAQPELWKRSESSCKFPFQRFHGNNVFRHFVPFLKVLKISIVTPVSSMPN